MRNEELYGQIKDLIEAQNKGMKAEMKANHDMIKLQLDNLILRVNKTNGHVAQNLQSIEDLRSQTRFIRWCDKRPYLAIPLLIIIFTGVVTFITYFGYDILFKIL